MIFTGSIINFEDGKKEAALEVLKTCPQIEVHTFSEDGRSAVVSIETEDSKELEAITDRLKKESSIKDIAHHYMYFGEETEKLLSESAQSPELGEFFKSARTKNGKAV
ncbi:hypothetical protein EP073_01080 [Geovibrio thiophilus]|uniref:Chaperone NapD n=1 Tax=Geovibrio thiophilus TaxID=139438 RepID=A0A410JV39_9BACT|nr:chaperone NapD [Geovibrio thiophilus]QAR32042.1 hypothetical protein EP073_01080 [Geovibrio thiophilus]